MDPVYSVVKARATTYCVLFSGPSQDIDNCPDLTRVLLFALFWSRGELRGSVTQSGGDPGPRDKGPRDHRPRDPGTTDPGTTDPGTRDPRDSTAGEQLRDRLCPLGQRFGR